MSAEPHCPLIDTLIKDIVNYFVSITITTTFDKLLEYMVVRKAYDFYIVILQLTSLRSTNLYL